MGAIKWGLPADAWRLGTNIVTNTNQPYNKYNDNNVVYNLNYIINKRNNFSRNPPYSNHTHGIVDTWATQKYIKVFTPWNKKVNISIVPQVILLDGICIHSTHRNLVPAQDGPFLYTRSHLSAL